MQTTTKKTKELVVCGETVQDHIRNILENPFCFVFQMCLLATWLWGGGLHCSAPFIVCQVQLTVDQLVRFGQWFQKETMLIFSLFFFLRDGFLKKSSASLHSTRITFCVIWANWPFFKMSWIEWYTGSSTQEEYVSSNELHFFPTASWFALSPVIPYNLVITFSPCCFSLCKNVFFSFSIVFFKI